MTTTIRRTTTVKEAATTGLMNRYDSYALATGDLRDFAEAVEVLRVEATKSATRHYRASATEILDGLNVIYQYGNDAAVKWACDQMRKIDRGGRRNVVGYATKHGLWIECKENRANKATYRKKELAGGLSTRGCADIRGVAKKLGRTY